MARSPRSTAIQLRIGQVYAFSVFKIPLTQLLGVNKFSSQRLVADANRMDLLSCNRDAWPFGRCVRQVARRRGP